MSSSQLFLPGINTGDPIRAEWLNKVKEAALGGTRGFQSSPSMRSPTGDTLVEPPERAQIQIVIAVTDIDAMVGDTPGVGTVAALKYDDATGGLVDADHPTFTAYNATDEDIEEGTEGIVCVKDKFNDWWIAENGGIAGSSSNTETTCCAGMELKKPVNGCCPPGSIKISARAFFDTLAFENQTSGSQACDCLDDPSSSQECDATDDKWTNPCNFLCLEVGDSMFGNECGESPTSEGCGCTENEASLPATFDLTLASLSDSNCTGCDELNGNYTLTQQSGSCTYTGGSVDPCGSSPFPIELEFLTVNGNTVAEVRIPTNGGSDNVVFRKTYSGIATCANICGDVLTFDGAESDNSCNGGTATITAAGCP